MAIALLPIGVTFATATAAPAAPAAQPAAADPAANARAAGGKRGRGEVFGRMGAQILFGDAAEEGKDAALQRAGIARHDEDAGRS